MTSSPDLSDLYVRIGTQTHRLSPGSKCTFGSGSDRAIRLPAGAPHHWFAFVFAAVWALRLDDETTDLLLDGRPVGRQTIVPLPEIGTGYRIELRRAGVELTVLAGASPAAVEPPGSRGATSPLPGPPRPPRSSPPPRPSASAAANRPQWRLEVDQETTIGRTGSGADIEVPDVNVAARHAVVRRTRHDTIVLYDKSHQLGTYVDGKRVLVARLAPGSRFLIGRHPFEVLSGGRLALPPQAVLQCTGLTARYRGQPRPHLSDVGFTLPVGEVMAVIGPSGAGKSTLCRALLGEIGHRTGTVALSDEPLPSGAGIGRLVSFVPQADSLHEYLTVRQFLRTTARLRLVAQGISVRDRESAVHRVLRDLALDEGEIPDTPIGKLSGGQRKRVSIAAELLSRPALLILDEPTSGLDEGLDRRTMALLRTFAAARECAVLVVTHSTANLDLADQVLAVTGGGENNRGRVGYAGPPQGLCAAFGAADHAEVMDRLREGAIVSPPPQLQVPARPAAAAVPGRQHGDPRRAARGGTAALRTTSLLTAREWQRWRAQPRRLVGPLGVFPAAAALLAAWADGRGLSGSAASGNTSLPTAVSVLAICTAFFAMALSFSSIVADREIIQREARWGVPPGAAVAAKALVVWTLAVVQSALAVLCYAVWRSAPSHPLAVGWGGRWSGVAAGVLLLGLSSAGLGLLVSAVSRALERVAFTLMGVLSVLVVLTGLLIPLGDPSGAGARLLSWASLLAPTRWGVAAIGADIGMDGAGPPDALWSHDTAHLAAACGALAVLAPVFASAAALVLRRQLARPL